MSTSPFLCCFLQTRCFSRLAASAGPGNQQWLRKSRHIWDNRRGLAPSTATGSENACMGYLPNSNCQCRRTSLTFPSEFTRSSGTSWPRSSPREQPLLPTWSSIDSTSVWRSRSWQKTLKGPFYGIWLDAPEGTVLSRIVGRQGGPSDADAAVLAAQIERGCGTVTWQRIDARGIPADIRNAILASLKVGVRKRS